MAIDKVKEYFKPLHMEDHILEFDVSSATVELAAEALHCEGKKIAKTMSFLVGEQPILLSLIHIFRFHPWYGYPDVLPVHHPG